MISAPVFGARASRETTHIRSPRRPCMRHPKGHIGYRNTDIGIAIYELAAGLPSEPKVVRAPDLPWRRVLDPERRNARDDRHEVVEGRLVRRHRGVPLLRPGVEAMDEDAAFPVRDADHAVRALVQLAADRLPAVELREARVRHESDHLPLRDRAADRPQGSLEELVRLADLDVFVEEHFGQAREDRHAGAALPDLSIQHIQY